MITIWIHNENIDKFTKLLENIEFEDEVHTQYYTYPKGNEYLQVLISLDKFVHLKEKNNV